MGSMGHISSSASGSAGGFGGPGPAAVPSGPFGGATQSFTALTTAAVLSAAAGGASPADLASNPLASLAVQKGGELVTSSLAKYMPGALALWRSLRYYFHVNNSYVRNKLSRLLFPFSRKWERSPATAADQDAGSDVAASFATPANDVNAPDLYIPLMAFVTFVLATGLVSVGLALGLAVAKAAHSFGTFSSCMLWPITLSGRKPRRLLPLRWLERSQRCLVCAVKTDNAQVLSCIAVCTHAFCSRPSLRGHLLFPSAAARHRHEVPP